MWLARAGAITAPGAAAIIVCAAFLVAWLLPYHTYPYYSFYSDYISLLGVAIGLLVLYFDERRAVAVVPLAVVLPLGVALVVAADAVTGRMWAPREALIPIGYLVLAAGAMLLGRNLAGPGADARRLDRAFGLLCAALVAAGLLSALITFCQYLGVDDRLGDWSVPFGSDGTSAIRPYANLGQPNQLALILSWSLAALWRSFTRHIVSGPVAFVMAVILLASMALTQSKLGWLIVPVLVALTWFGNRRSGTRKVSSVALVALVAVFVFFILALPSLSHFLGTMTEDVTKRMETNGVRSVMILQGLYIGWQHPFAGVGWGGFGAGQVAVAPLFGETQYAAHAHDFVANLAAETGWLVTSCAVAAIGLWSYRRYVVRKITTDTLFAAMFFGAVAIHSLVEFPLWYAYILLPTAFLVGLVDGELDIIGRTAIGRVQVVALSLVAALSMMFVATDYRGLVQAFRAFGLQRVGIVYESGSLIEPRWTIFPHFYRYMAFARLEPTVGMTPAEIAGAEDVAGRFGYAPVLMRMATIYALNERPDDAVRLVIAMSRLYPQRYRETYQAWRSLAGEYPAVLGKVFERLPAPPPPSS